MSKATDTKCILNLKRQVAERDQMILELIGANSILRSLVGKSFQTPKIRQLVEYQQKVYPETRLVEVLRMVGISLSEWESLKSKQ